MQSSRRECRLADSQWATPVGTATAPIARAQCTRSSCPHSRSTQPPSLWPTSPASSTPPVTGPRPRRSVSRQSSTSSWPPTPPTSWAARAERLGGSASEVPTGATRRARCPMWSAATTTPSYKSAGTTPRPTAHGHRAGYRPKPSGSTPPASGLDRRRYPWGDELLTTDGRWRCNIWQGSFPTANTVEDGWLTTAPVRTYEPNGYGL